MNCLIEIGMNSGGIKLIEPAIELKAEFLAMAEEFKAEGADVINGVGCIEPGDFENSVKRAKEHVEGIGLPEGWVPASTYWLVRDEILIGTCNLRHELNVFLESPERKRRILSVLHSNIQDTFNLAGLQIMSPHYVADPAEKVWVPQEKWQMPIQKDDDDSASLDTNNGDNINT